MNFGCQRATVCDSQMIMNSGEQPAATVRPDGSSDILIRAILDSKTYYELLEVQFDAPDAEIRKQYLRKSKQVHPGMSSDETITINHTHLIWKYR